MSFSIVDRKLSGPVQGHASISSHLSRQSFAWFRSAHVCVAHSSTWKCLMTYARKALHLAQRHYLLSPETAPCVSGVPIMHGGRSVTVRGNGDTSPMHSTTKACVSIS